MRNETIIQGREVKNLVTQYYYKNQHLHFRIVLNLGFGKQIHYNDFEDYYSYKKMFSKLLKAKDNNSEIFLAAA